tara:strand:- start:4889 stop:7984 length:3096 start_codon:yes stop_codon:yes gene_type:complete
MSDKIDEPKKNENKNLKILKKGAVRLGFYGIKYYGLPGFILQGTVGAGAVAGAGVMSTIGIIGSFIIIGILYYCTKKSKKNKNFKREKMMAEYDNMLKNAEIYEKRQREKEELRYTELLNDIFNDESYDEIKIKIKNKNKYEQVRIIACEYGKLIVELYSRELLLDKKDQMGGGKKITDEIFNDINNEDTIEKSTEIQKIIYDIFEVNIKDYNELFINTLSDEIIVILPLLYLNSGKSKIRSIENLNDLHINNVCDWRIKEINTNLETSRVLLKKINVPKKKLIDDPKPINNKFFDNWRNSPSSSKNIYNLSFKNALNKKRDFYLSVFKNRLNMELPKINKIYKLNLPNKKGSGYMNDIIYYKRLLSEYNNIVNLKLEETINNVDTAKLFTNTNYKGKKKITIKNGKLDNKYPYYTVHVLDDGVYNIKEILPDKIILENDEIILINPIDISQSNEIVDNFIKDGIREKFDKIELHFLNISSRENYIKISEEINNIINKLQNSSKSDIILLINEFEQINNKIIGNNNEYISNIEKLENKKNNTIQRIMDLEKSEKIINNGCELLEKNNWELYIDVDKNIYTKDQNGNNIYISDDLKKKYKKLIPYIEECKKLKQKKLIRNKILDLGKKTSFKKKQIKIENQIEKLNKLIPNINRICINLQFYESEKMYNNKIKASLIHQKLKLNLIEYINNNLDIIESIFYIKSKIRTFDKITFINNFKNLNNAPFDIKLNNLNIEKGNNIYGVQYTDNNFIINDINVSYDEIFNIFEQNIKELTNRLKDLLESCEIDYNNHFNLLDDIYCYRINYSDILKNYRDYNMESESSIYLNMVNNNNIYNNITILKKNDKELLLKAKIYKIQIINDNLIQNCIIIKTDHSKIFYDNGKYSQLTDNINMINTIGMLKNIGTNFILERERHVELIAFDIDNNKPIIINFNTNIYINDIYFVIKINDSKININNKTLINENKNYFIVNGESLAKDPNKIYSKFKLDKETDIIHDKKLDLSNYNNDTGSQSSITSKSLLDATEETAELIS